MASSREYLLAEQIYSKWNATTALATSCAGGLHHVVTKQPADTSAITEPYCNFTVDITNVKKQAGAAVQVLTAIVKFEVFGSVALLVSNALGDIQTTFAYGTLLTDPTDGNFLAMTAEPNSKIDDPMWRRGGALPWRGTHVCKVVFSL